MKMAGERRVRGKLEKDGKNTIKEFLMNEN